MAKHNKGDILTDDWNPVIGCKRYSAACNNCWYLDGIFPWQQILGIIPEHVQAKEFHLFEKRMSVETKIAGLPFFIKQLGNNHKDSKRVFYRVQKIT